jgi:hypothetical protein
MRIVLPGTLGETNSDLVLLSGRDLGRERELMLDHRPDALLPDQLLDRQAWPDQERELVYFRPSHLNCRRRGPPRLGSLYGSRWRRRGRRGSHAPALRSPLFRLRVQGGGVAALRERRNPELRVRADRARVPLVGELEIGHRDGVFAPRVDGPPE